MPLTLTKVHVAEKVPGSEATRITRTNHYVRVCADNGPPCYIQNGTVYGEGGPAIELDQYPEWFWVEVSKLSPHALEAVGFEIPEDKVVVPPRNISTGRQRNRR
jgi:hypothetical protein